MEQVKTLFRNRHKQSGQASLEMVLVLVIGMMIALGLVYRFNTAFKKYTIDMYGTYYRCLLETGELPGIGTICKDKKAAYAIASGSTLVNNQSGPSGGSSGSSSPNTNSGGSGGGSGSGSGGKGGGSSGKSSGGGSGDSSGGGSSADSGSEAVGNGSSSKSGGRGASVIGRLRGLQNKKVSTAVGTTGGGDKEAGDGGLPPPLAVGRTRGGSDDLRGVRTKMNFEMEGEGYARRETAGVTATTATAKAPGKKGESGDSLRPRKAVEKGESTVTRKLDNDKGGGLEFGKLFRLFLIIGIVIAIVIFLGGQVLQISKGGEK